MARKKALPVSELLPMQMQLCQVLAQCINMADVSDDLNFVLRNDKCEDLIARNVVADELYIRRKLLLKLLRAQRLGITVNLSIKIGL